MKVFNGHFTIIVTSIIICGSHLASTQKDYNEILLNLDKKSNIEIPNISSVIPTTFKENVRVKENENNMINNNINEAIKTPENISKNIPQSFEVLKENTKKPLNITKDKKENKLIENNPEAFKKNTNSVNSISKSGPGPTPPVQLDIEAKPKISERKKKDLSNRFKKEISTTKVSEPREYEYNYKDSITGAYNFGFGTHDQYREEKRTADGVTVGRFGWMDPVGVWHRTNYIADILGYRVISSDAEMGFPETVGLPLTIPHSHLTSLPYGTHSVPNIPLLKSETAANTPNVSNVGQMFNPSVESEDLFGEEEANEEEEEEEEEEKENSEKEEEEDSKFMNPLHYIEFVDPVSKQQNLVSDSLQLPQQPSEIGTLFPNHNVNPHAFPSKNQQPFPTYPLLAKEPSDETNEGDITTTNLQDMFFKKLPLKPFRPSISPELNKPFQRIASNLLSNWSNRRSWPATVERVPKPLSGRSNQNQFMRRSSRGDMSLEDRPTPEKGESKFGKSIFDAWKGNSRTQSSPFKQVSQRPFMNTRYQYQSPTYTSFRVDSPNKSNPGFLKQYLQNMYLHSSILRQNPFQPSFPPSVYPSIPEYNQKIHLGPYFDRAQIINSVIPTPTIIPFRDTLASITVPYWQRYLVIPLPTPQPFPMFPSLVTQNSPSLNVIGTFPIHDPSLTPAKPKPADFIDYLLLTEEFSKVNGSIANHPDFVHIHDHLSNMSLDNTSMQNTSETNSPLIIIPTSELETTGNNILLDDTEASDEMDEEVTISTTVNDFTSTATATEETDDENGFRLRPPLISNRLIVPLTSVENDRKKNKATSQSESETTKYDEGDQFKLEKRDQLQRIQEKLLGANSQKDLEVTEKETLEAGKIMNSGVGKDGNLYEERPLPEALQNSLFEKLFQSILKTKQKKETLQI